MRILGASLAFILAAGCGSESTTPSVEQEEVEMLADNIAYTMTHFLTHDGVRTAVAVSDTAYFHLNEGVWNLVGVDVVFYDPNGVESGRVTSETGDYFNETGEFVARGNVVLTSSQQGQDRRLETQALHYDMRSDSLWTDVPFTLHDAGEVSTGTSFRSDSKLTTWTVTGARTQSTVGDGGLSF
jgi:LPS export ABC transporter protein LptC